MLIHHGRVMETTTSRAAARNYFRCLVTSFASLSALVATVRNRILTLAGIRFVAANAFSAAFACSIVIKVSSVYAV
jgi:hypothetical protein